MPARRPVRPADAMLAASGGYPAVTITCSPDFSSTAYTTGGQTYAGCLIPTVLDSVGDNTVDVTWTATMGPWTDNDFSVSLYMAACATPSAPTVLQTNSDWANGSVYTYTLNVDSSSSLNEGACTMYWVTSTANAYFYSASGSLTYISASTQSAPMVITPAGGTLTVTCTPNFQQYDAYFVYISSTFIMEPGCYGNPANLAVIVDSSSPDPWELYAGTASTSLGCENTTPTKSGFGAVVASGTGNDTLSYATVQPASYPWCEPMMAVFPGWAAPPTSYPWGVSYMLLDLNPAQLSCSPSYSTTAYSSGSITYPGCSVAAGTSVTITPEINGEMDLVWGPCGTGTYLYATTLSSNASLDTPMTNGCTQYALTSYVNPGEPAWLVPGPPVAAMVVDFSGGSLTLSCAADPNYPQNTTLVGSGVLTAGISRQPCYVPNATWSAVTGVDHVPLAVNVTYTGAAVWQITWGSCANAPSTWTNSSGWYSTSETLTFTSLSLAAVVCFTAASTDVPALAANELQATQVQSYVDITEPLVGGPSTWSWTGQSPVASTAPLATGSTFGAGPCGNMIVPTWTCATGPYTMQSAGAAPGPCNLLSGSTPGNMECFDQTFTSDVETMAGQQLSPTLTASATVIWQKLLVAPQPWPTISLAANPPMLYAANDNGQGGRTNLGATLSAAPSASDWYVEFFQTDPSGGIVQSAGTCLWETGTLVGGLGCGGITGTSAAEPWVAPTAPGTYYFEAATGPLNYDSATLSYNPGPAAAVSNIVAVTVYPLLLSANPTNPNPGSPTTLTVQMAPQYAGCTIGFGSSTSPTGPFTTFDTQQTTSGETSATTTYTSATTQRLYFQATTNCNAAGQVTSNQDSNTIMVVWGTILNNYPT